MASFDDNNAAAQIPLIVDMTLDDIATGLDNGHFTSVQLVKTFLARIKEVGRIFHSVIETNPDAIRIAQELDDERNLLQKRRGPLHGVPLLLKDNIVTIDKMEATAGSIALIGSKPAQESSIVTRLRAAGSILLGKANMSEWAGCRLPYPLGSGWSARGGQGTNPYYPNMLIAGSSTGSAVSTTLGLAFAALGTETCGSILNPAKKNNVVGLLKPTTGLVARDAIIPVSYQQDTIGPFSRTVKDAAHILTQIAGKSPLDARTHDIPFDIMPDFAASCTGISLNGVRIGIPRNVFLGDGLGGGSVEENAFMDALQTLAQAGAKIVEDTNILAINEYRNLLGKDQETVVYTDFNGCLPKYFESLEINPNNLHTLEELMDYTKNEPKEENSTRGMGRFELAQGINTESQQFKDIIIRRQYIAGEGGIAGAIKRHKVDLLAVPSTANIAMVCSAAEGSPAVSVPLGSLPADTPVEKIGNGDFIETGPNTPFSILFFANRYEEQTLIRVAYAFEQLTKARNQVQPYKEPTTEIRSIISDERRETTLETSEN